MNKFFENNSDYFYAIFRVVFGVFFFTHGFAKWGAVMSFDLSNMMFYAGIIEMLVGILLVIGLFTRYAAILGVLQMAAAFIIGHVMQKDGSIILNPLANKGELALLFLTAFLLIAAFGGRILSVDSKMQKK